MQESARRHAKMKSRIREGRLWGKQAQRKASTLQIRLHDYVESASDTKHIFIYLCTKLPSGYENYLTLPLP